LIAINISEERVKKEAKEDRKLILTVFSMKKWRRERRETQFGRHCFGTTFFLER